MQFRSKSQSSFLKAFIYYLGQILFLLALYVTSWKDLLLPRNRIFSNFKDWKLISRGKIYCRIQKWGYFCMKPPSKGSKFAFFKLGTHLYTKIQIFFKSMHRLHLYIFFKDISCRLVNLLRFYYFNKRFYYFWYRIYIVYWHFKRQFSLIFHFLCKFMSIFNSLCQLSRTDYVVYFYAGFIVIYTKLTVCVQDIYNVCLD